jgi:hypothetical protein
MDGVAAPGVAASYSSGDHKHPSDTSKASVAYVDAGDTALANANAAQNTAIAGKVAKIGDTMTGALTITPATSHSIISLMPAEAGQQAMLNLGQAGVEVTWQVGRHVDNSFLVYDIAGAHAPINIPPNGTSMFLKRAATIYGYSPKGGVSDLNGAIILGSNASFQGAIQYDTSSGVGKLYIENSQVHVSSEIILRTHTSGTPIEGLRLDGFGKAHFLNTSILAGGYTEYNGPSGGNQFKVKHSPELSLNWAFNDGPALLSLNYLGQLYSLEPGVGVQYNSKISVRQSTVGIAHFEFGHGNLAGYGSTIGCENSTGMPFIAFNCGPGTTTHNSYKTLGLKGSVIRGDLAGGFLFGKVDNANADNQGLTTLATLGPDGRLSVAAGPTAALHAATKQYVDTSSLNPGVMKAGVFMGNAGNIIFSYSIASVTDTGVGYCDINYSTPFAANSFVPVAQVVGVSPFDVCNIGIPSTTSCRIHCGNNAGVLVDPTSYSFWAGGTQ